MTLIEKLKSYVNTMINKYNIYKSCWDCTKKGSTIDQKYLAEIDGVNVLEIPQYMTQVEDLFASTATTTTTTTTMELRKSFGNPVTSFVQEATVQGSKPTTLDFTKLDQSKMYGLNLSGFRKITSLVGMDFTSSTAADILNLGNGTEFPPNVVDIEFIEGISLDDVYYEIYINAYTALSENTMSSLLNAIEAVDVEEFEDYGYIYISSEVYEMMEATDLPDQFLAKGWCLIDYSTLATTTSADTEV